jgi:microcystin-dependent protein
MGILNKIKGFIKLSEVATDSAQTLLDTSVNQDANTVITQAANALEDALRKQSLLLLSTGNVTWASNTITPDIGVDMTVKLFQNSNGQTVNLNLSYANFSSGVSLPNDGDVLYLELNRSLLTSGTISIYNGGGNTGQRAVVGSGMPPLVNNQSGGFQGTICIPIAVRQGTNIWWVPSNFYWANGTTGNLGTPGAASVMPIGTVTPFAGSTAPIGWLMCDGSVISQSLYPGLWSLIGSTYNKGGEGAGTFRLPDLRGKTIVCSNNASLPAGANAYYSTRNLGDGKTDGGIGSQTVALSETELPMHTHIFYDSYWCESNSPPNYSPYETIKNSPLNQGAGFTEVGGNPRHGVYDVTETVTSSTNNGWNSVIASNLAGNAHNNMQPSIVLNYIIKA